MHYFGKWQTLPSNRQFGLWDTGNSRGKYRLNFVVKEEMESLWKKCLFLLSHKNECPSLGTLRQVQNTDGYMKLACSIKHKCVCVSSVLVDDVQQLNVWSGEEVVSLRQITFFWVLQTFIFSFSLDSQGRCHSNLSNFTMISVDMSLSSA